MKAKQLSINNPLVVDSPAVYILLSTYNGSQFLAPLLDSLFRQTYRNFFVNVRDDGSTDSTLAVLMEYSSRYSNMSVVAGDNIGVIPSFMSLLQTSPATTDSLFAFCDQDDVWVHKKLMRAVQALQSFDCPADGLYCCRLQYTDAQLREMGVSQIPIYLGFANALVENVAIGCTQVFGANVRQRLLAANPRHMMMHDWWAYLVATAFGKVYFDPEVGVLYRQHRGNTVGWDKRIGKMLIKSGGFLHNLVWQRQGLQSLSQAKHFMQTYPDLSAEKIQLLSSLLALRENSSLSSRCTYLQHTDVHRNNYIEDKVLASSILLKLH